MLSFWQFWSPFALALIWALFWFPSRLWNIIPFLILKAILWVTSLSAPQWAIASYITLLQIFMVFLLFYISEPYFCPQKTAGHLIFLLSLSIFTTPGTSCKFTIVTTTRRLLTSLCVLWARLPDLLSYSIHFFFWKCCTAIKEVTVEHCGDNITVFLWEASRRK